jgi:hypothetical protein
LLLSVFTIRSRRTHGTFFRVAASQLETRPKRKVRSDLSLRSFSASGPLTPLRNPDFGLRILFPHSAFRIPKFLGGLSAFLITNLLNYDRQVTRHRRQYANQPLCLSIN